MRASDEERQDPEPVDDAGDKTDDELSQSSDGDNSSEYENRDDEDESDSDQEGSDDGCCKDSTPLMQACCNGTTQEVTILLSAQAAIDVQDSAGLTALMYAMRGKHVSIADQLIAEGSDVNLTDGKGRAAVWYASANSDTAVLS